MIARSGEARARAPFRALVRRHRSRRRCRSRAWAVEPFVVRDIRVEGVQRTEAGTIFSYLPIKVGDRVTDEKISDAVKALYATGFFRDVRLEAQGDVLIVAVQERPTISSITFVGNKEFDTDTIKKALKDIGIAEARIFDRSALDRAEQELKRQYITRGKYAANVQTTVTPQERNRVAINFTIDEGDSAKIARINIVGAKAFTEKQLLSEMTLTTPGWLTWYTKNDQYSKQKLSADLETLRSYYQNRGYLEFNVDSTQVSITPDKEDIYITLNITEGPQFTVGDVRIAGDLVVPAGELERLIRIKPGDVFSRERLQASAKDVSDRLGAEGYAFANVNAVPELDRDNADGVVHVLRRSGPPRVRAQDQHQRQREDARRGDPPRVSPARGRVVRRPAHRAVEGARQAPRLFRRRQRRDAAGARQRRTRSTSKSRVVEKSTGNLLAGVGYSSAEGIVLNASISQQNIFGSGNALALGVNTSRFNRTYSIAVHRAVLHGRRRLAHDRGSTRRASIRRSCRSRSTRRRRSARRLASACRSPRPTRSISAAASSTRTSRCSPTARRSTSISSTSSARRRPRTS